MKNESIFHLKAEGTKARKTKCLAQNVKIKMLAIDKSFCFKNGCFCTITDIHMVHLQGWCKFNISNTINTK